MIHLYTHEYYEDVKKEYAISQRILYLIIFGGLVLNVAIFLVKMLCLEWGQSDFAYYLINSITLSAWILAWFIYYRVTHKPTKKYFNDLRQILSQEATVEIGYFLGMDREPILKDGIEYHDMLFYKGKDHKGLVEITRLMWDIFSQMPDIEIGQKVTFTSVKRVMRSYEVSAESLDEKTLAKIIDNVQTNTGLDMQGEEL